jgi:hypothetical protein
MYLRRVRAAARSFAAAPAHLPTAATPPASAAQGIGVGLKYLGIGLRRPCRGKTSGGMLEVSRDAAAVGE